MSSNKDLEDFKALYLKYAPNLIAFASKFSSPAISEDIVHDVFIRIWKKKLFLLPDDEQIKLLYTAVKNACVDHLRRSLLEQKFKNTQALQLRLDELDFQQSAEYNFLQGDLIKQVHKQVKELPEKQQQIFCLFYGNGLRSNEIAQKLNLSVRTIENQLYRALLTLRKKVKCLS